MRPLNLGRMKRILIIWFLMASITGFAQVDQRQNAIYFSKGIEQKYKDDVQGAIDNFEKALKVMPDDAASMFELSEQYVKAGRVEEAFAMAKEAAKIDPENKWYKEHLQLFRDVKALAGDDFYLTIPDLMENADVLASLRGAQNTIFDMIDEPEEAEERILRGFLA